MLGKKVFKAIELLTVIVSCIAALILSQNVWEKYRSYESNFIRSEGPASESPTITICLLQQVQADPFQYFQDFNVSYIVDIDHENLQILNEGTNIIETKGKFVNGTRTNVSYEVMDSWYGGYEGYQDICHRITSDLISNDIWTGIRVNFDESVLKENLPKVTVIISSKINSIGKMFNKFYEGEIHNEVSSFNNELWMKFRSYDFVYLDQSSSPKSDCRNGVNFYQCFDGMILQEIGNACPAKCYPGTKHWSKIQRCVTEEEIDCARDITARIRLNKTLAKKCPKSCMPIEYRKMYKWAGNWVEKVFNISSQERSFWFWYRTADDAKIFTEYLIHDANSMVGSIGGTLGLFIGFSFNNVISFVIKKLQNHFYGNQN